MVMKILLIIPACSGRSTDIALESSESQDLRTYVYKINDIQNFGGGDPLLTTTQKFLGTSLYVHMCIHMYVRTYI